MSIKLFRKIIFGAALVLSCNVVSAQDGDTVPILHIRFSVSEILPVREQLITRAWAV